MMDIRVLYEDNQVIVIEKPQNIPSQGDSSGDESVLEMVREYVRVKYNKPGQAWLGLVHRLDRPAGGVMVFARTSKAASRLSQQIQDGIFNKIYLAIVGSEIPAQGRLEDWLVKDRRTNTTSRGHEGQPGAKLAKLEYETVAKSGRYSLLRIRLYTGRPHQIRVQMKLAGAPLAGDRRYGGPAESKLCLWSEQVSFRHPTRPEQITVRCDPPMRGNLWPLFRAEFPEPRDKVSIFQIPGGEDMS